MDPESISLFRSKGHPISKIFLRHYTMVKSFWIHFICPKTIPNGFPLVSSWRRRESTFVVWHPPGAVFTIFDAPFLKNRTNYQCDSNATSIYGKDTMNLVHIRYLPSMRSFLCPSENGSEQHFSENFGNFECP